MSDNSAICPALKLADRTIRKAMASASSCKPETTEALGALRYVEQALQREGDELKITKFAVMDPLHTVESLTDPNLAETAFCERAQRALEALEQLKDICGCSR
jgi:hypothetical protein